MAIFARIENGYVMELVTPLDGFTIKDSYHPTVATQFVDVSHINPTPQVGLVYDGVHFAEPPETPKRPPIAIAVDRYAELEKRIAELEKQIQPKKKSSVNPT